MKVTEDLVKSLIGKYVHVTNNFLEVNSEEGTRVSDMWFGGKVAGYQARYTYFDFKKEEPADEQIQYHLIMTDGEGFMLAEECDIEELDEESFFEKLNAFMEDAVTRDLQQVFNSGDDEDE